jgi:hypothetical protein
MHFTLASDYRSLSKDEASANGAYSAALATPVERPCLAEISVFTELK